MPTTPAPQIPLPRTPPLSGTWTLEKRQVAGVALGLFCLGIIIGARIGRGSVPMVEGGPMVVKSGPCPDCAERTIQQARARQSVPGHAPPPPPDSVSVTDTSKSHVADPSFIESTAPGDSSVPGM